MKLTVWQVSQIQYFQIAGLYFIRLSCFGSNVNMGLTVLKQVKIKNVGSVFDVS